MRSGPSESEKAYTPIVVLMGARASGKSTVGRNLAERMGRRFIDLDDRTAALLGEVSAGLALSTHGLAAFRSAETTALGRVLEERDVVLALGGGTPTAPGAAELLRGARQAATARIVYLNVGIPTLRSRLASDPTLRPSLTGLAPSQEIERLMVERDPIYRGLADLIIDGEAGTAPEVAERIQRGLSGV